MIKVKETPLGVRVSNQLKKSMDDYCRRQGVSRKHFVEEAIKNKLMEIIEDEQDLKTAKERLAENDFVSEREMEAYFAKRLKEK